MHEYNKKKKISIITYRFPFPDDDGGKIRVVNFIKSLYKKYDIYLYSLDFNIVDLDKINIALKYCKKVNVYKINKFIAIVKLPFKFIFSREPLQLVFFTNRKLKKTLNGTFFDFVYFNTFRTVYYQKFINCKRSVLDYVDAISMNYFNAKKSSKYWMKCFYYFEHKRALKYEISLLNLIDVFIIISNVDQKYFYDHGFNKKINVIPNYVKEIKNTNNQNTDKNVITFLGKMSYEPNISAVLTYINKIHPHIISRQSDIKLVIIGGGAPFNIIKYSEKANLSFTGFVEDPYEIIARSMLFIAPMVSGAGIQNKILEAMFIGKCVITTTKGAEGLPHLNGDEIIITDDFETFGSNIIELLKDEKKIITIGKNAKEYIINNFSKESISRMYNDLFIH